MRSLVCKLTGNKQVAKGQRGDFVLEREGECARGESKVTRGELEGAGGRGSPYLLSAPALRHCPTGSAYIDRDAGLEQEGKRNVNQKLFLL